MNRLMLRLSGKHFVSPVMVMLLTLLFIGLVQVAAIYGVTHQAWTGLRLASDPISGFLRVESVAGHSPATGKIHPGDILVAVKAGAGSIPLTPLAIINPKELGTHKALAESLAVRRQLYQAFTSGKPLHFVIKTGVEIAVFPETQRSVADIPVIYWWLLLANVAGALIGAFILGYRPYERVSIFLFIAGIGHYCHSVSYAVLNAQDLFLSPQWVYGLAVTQVAAMHLFVFGMFSMQVSYPRQLLQGRFLYGLAFAQALLTVNYCFQWVEIPFHIFFLQFLPLFWVSLGFIVRQWMLAQHQPVNRAAVLVSQLSIMLPSLAMVLFYAFPLVLGYPPLLDDVVTHFMPLVIFIGWAVAILRYRLFEVEYWWFKSWLWLLGGGMVILVDMLLVGLLNTPQAYSLGLSVLVAGFLYFPLRQWLLGKLMPLDSQSVQDMLPAFSASLASAVSPAEFAQRWQDALQARFRPLHFTLQPEILASAELAENGLYLSVPALNQGQSYRLTGKQMAARLFNKADIKTVNSLLEIARIASNASETRQQAVLTERSRIMHDLHDTVGAKLLTLAHTLPMPRHKKVARDALQTLRDMIALSLQKTPFQLGEYLSDWRAEVVERTEPSDVHLNWQVDPQLETYTVTPRQIVEMAVFIRETVATALQKPKLTQIDVDAWLEQGQLQLRIMWDADPQRIVTYTPVFSSERTRRG